MECSVMHCFVQYSVLATEGGNQELTLASHSNTHTVSRLSDTDRNCVHTSTCLLFMGESVNKRSLASRGGELSPQALLEYHSQLLQQL